MAIPAISFGQTGTSRIGLPERRTNTGRENMTNPKAVHGGNDLTSDTRVSMKLEAVVIPVADVDSAKTFYGNLGWRLDAVFSFDNGFRVVQFTPPGSGCSVQFGTKITDAAPGSGHGLYLIVSDIEAGRDELVRRGAKVSGVFHSGAPGAQLNPEGKGDRVSGPD